MASSSGGPPLRQLRWASTPPVDLLEECHWLVTLESRGVDHGRIARHLEVETWHQPPEHETASEQLQDATKQKSPYRQQLRRPKVPATSPGSPAQRAAKSILKLKEGLLHLDEAKWPLDTSEIAANQSVVAIVRRQRQQEVGTPPTRSLPKATVISLSRENVKSGTRGTSSRSSPQRSPNRKKQRPLTREAREARDLSEKQAHLAVWLKAHPDENPASACELVAVDDDDEVGSSTSGLYSLEVEARIETAMQCRAPLDSGVGLWDDPVRSLLAAEMTSESVFGGVVPTRGLAFQPPQAASPSRLPIDVDSSDDNTRLPHSPEKQPSGPAAVELDDPADRREEQAPIEGTLSSGFHTELSGHARQVYSTAHRQVADGAVADALATLEAGIRQSLSTSQAHQDAASGSRGPAFNYSVLAHANATKLQLYYRARHRRRVNRLVSLQRHWRCWHVERVTQSSKRFEDRQAKILQRNYRDWHVRIAHERSADRIQRNFRIFSSQKHLIRFRQVCRLLLAREARRRRLKARIRVVARLLLIWRGRKRRIVLMQSLWRARVARVQFELLLDGVSAVEHARRAREDAFVALRLAQARPRFREFLTTTRRGRELVRWQQEKPWLRFRRLRRDSGQWDQLPLSEKIEVVVALLPGRRFRGLQRRALCQMLTGKNQQVPSIPFKELQVSSEGFRFLTVDCRASNAPPAWIPPVGCCPWWLAMRQRTGRVGEMLCRRATWLWWSLVVWPKEYVAAQLWPIRGRRAMQARQQLEEDCARVLATFLKAWFRRSGDRANTPPLACEWCYEPFATAHEYFAHGKCASARARADAEWTALTLDVAFVHCRQWRKSKTAREYVHPDVRTFSLDATAGRRLRDSPSQWRALDLLIATMEACMGTESDVVPSDLAGFLLQYLDVDGKLHPLLESAEHQLVRWSKDVEPSNSAAKEVGRARTAPAGSDPPRQWIRKDELRARLLLPSKWRHCFPWRSQLGSKYKERKGAASNPAQKGEASSPGPVGGAAEGSTLASKWRGLQLRVQRMVQHRKQRVGSDHQHAMLYGAAVRKPSSPSATRVVVPVAT
ncbi:hypothetical protein BBJ28_00003480 [Nothophytophthora sp. Chile5]|nr:hypothetical protein BBJ28_00003480 [Nothophytophthora sp. Chile5]